MTKGPESDQIEITIIGPGYGESLVIHVGEQNWYIVDSCIDPLTGKNLTIEYLESINVNLATDVRGIIATHWHDDHIAGISEIVSKCTSSNFYCPKAMLKHEFCTLTRLDYSKNMTSNSGSQEFNKILEILAQRKKDGGKQRVLYIDVDRLLASEDFQISNLHIKFRLYSLSPSDREFELAMNTISKLIKDLDGPIRVPVALQRNFTSAVLWFELNEITILLGADLLYSSDSDRGWLSILNNSTVPKSKAVFFKIPHHGSHTGYCREVWDKLVVDNVFSATTPFRRGSNKVPSSSDVNLILGHTQNSYITKLKSEKYVTKSRNLRVQKFLKNSNKQVDVISFSSDKIRFRKNVSDNSNEWSIEKFGSSTELLNYI